MKRAGNVRGVPDIALHGKVVSSVSDLVSIAAGRRRNEGANKNVGQKGTESHRQARRQPRTHAPDDARNESRETRGRFGPDVSTSPEIRKRHQPDRRQPAATDFSDPSSSGF